MKGFLFVVLLLVAVYVPFIPSSNDFSDVKKVEILLSDYLADDGWPNKKWRVSQSRVNNGWGRYERMLVSEEDIKTFEQVFGRTWDGLFPLNSYEGMSFYVDIKIHRINGDIDRFQFTDKEWGVSSKTNEKLLHRFKEWFK